MKPLSCLGKVALVTMVLVLCSSAAQAAAPVFDTEDGKYSYVFPYYVVEVAENETISLKDVASITSYADAEADGVAISYDDFLAVTAGTFFKTGTGTLKIDTGLVNWTGNFQVMAGVLHVSHVDGFGLSSGSNAAYAHNGATLVTENPDGVTKLDVDDYACKRILGFEGEGFNGMGGLRVINNGSESTWPLMKEPTLTGDALLILDNKAGVMQNWRPAGVLRLNGHHLVIRAAAGRTRPSIRFNNTDITAGSILVDNVDLTWQGAYRMAGDASNVLVLTNDSNFINSSSVTGIGNRQWTLRLEQLRMFSIGGNNNTSDYYGWDPDQIANNCWDGPVILNCDVPMYNGLSLNYHHTGASFLGQVSGKGGFRPYGSTTLRYISDMALQLACPTNSFEGGVTLADGGRLILHKNGALPADGGAAVITNGSVVLVGPEAYALPELHIAGTGCVTQTGLGGGQWKRIVKSGDGLLTYDANAGAAELDVQGGMIKLPAVSYDWSSAAGLTESTNYCKNGSSEDYKNGVAYETGRTLLQPLVAYNAKGWYDYAGRTYALYIYKGYIWSQATTDEVWSAAMVMDKGGRLYIDGELIIDQTVRNMAKTANFTISPGPHAFEFRYFCTTGNSGATSTGYAETVFHYIDDEEFRQADRTNSLGKYISPAPGVNGGQWVDGYGLVIDRLGRRTHNYEDYKKLVDSGDGKLFTWTSNAVDVACLGDQPTFAAMKFAPGTTLDITSRPVPYETAALTGCPTVLNGDLAVTDSWTVDAAEVATGAKLTMTGAFALADGAKIVVTESAKTRASPADGWTLAEAESGLTLPEDWLETAELPADGSYSLKLSADGKRLSLIHRKGLILLVR